MKMATLGIGIVLALVLVSCGDKNENPTPLGTVVIQWDHTQSERASMKTAQIGARKSSNISHTSKMFDGSTVTLGIALVTAPVTFVEDGVTKEYLAPVLVSAKLDKNADFTFAEGACKGPHYQMARPTPREMIVECRARARKPSADLVLAFDVYGDGRVVDSYTPPAPAK